MELSLYEVSLPFSQYVNSLKVDSFKLARIELNSKYFDLFSFPGFSNFDLEESYLDFKTAIEQLTSVQEPLIDPFAINHRNPHVEHALFQYSLLKQKGPLKKLNDESFLIKNIETLVEYSQHSHIKLKISNDLNQFISTVKALKHYSSKVKDLSFRLDANQRLSPETLTNYYSLLVDFKISEHLDYFEEPFYDYSLYPTIDSTIPIALEENIDHFLSDNLNFQPKAIVYKPSQQGISKLKRLKNQTIVISSCFDPKWSYKATLAIAHNYPYCIHGLSAKSEDLNLRLIRKTKL